MPKVQAALHALSLGACLTLGAGFWHLRMEAPPQGFPSPRPFKAEASGPSRLPALERELESLRLRVAELEARPASPAVPAGAFAVAAPPAPASSSQDGAFEAKLLEIVEKSLLQGGGDTITFPSSQRKPLGFEGMDLSEPQKDAEFQDRMKGSRVLTGRTDSGPTLPRVPPFRRSN